LHANKRLKTSFERMFMFFPFYLLIIFTKTCKTILAKKRDLSAKNEWNWETVANWKMQFAVNSHGFFKLTPALKEIIKIHPRTLTHSPNENIVVGGLIFDCNLNCILQ
jgi:hypothetical protein